MTPYARLRSQLCKIIGEYTGMLEGISAWNIPAELRDRLKPKLEELKAMKLPDPKEEQNDAVEFLKWARLNCEFTGAPKVRYHHWGKNGYKKATFTEEEIYQVYLDDKNKNK